MYLTFDIPLYDRRIGLFHLQIYTCILKVDSQSIIASNKNILEYPSSTGIKKARCIPLVIIDDPISSSLLPSDLPLLTDYQGITMHFRSPSNLSWRSAPFSLGLGPASLSVTVPAGSWMCCSVSSASLFAGVTSSCNSLQTFDTLFQRAGARTKSSRPLQLTDLTSWIGRACLCGASESLFKIVVPYAPPHASKSSSGGADILERIL